MILLIIAIGSVCMAGLVDCIILLPREHRKDVAAIRSIFKTQ